MLAVGETPAVVLAAFYNHWTAEAWAAVADPGRCPSKPRWWRGAQAPEK